MFTVKVRKSVTALTQFEFFSIFSLFKLKSRIPNLDNSATMLFDSKRNKVELLDYTLWLEWNHEIATNESVIYAKDVKTILNTFKDFSLEGKLR